MSFLKLNGIPQKNYNETPIIDIKTYKNYRP